MSLLHRSSLLMRIARRPFSRRAIFISIGLALIIVLLILGRMRATPLPSSVGGNLASGNLLVLALPAFLAGLLSFLSPCCLPILPTYFAFTFQARREQIVQMTVAFFLGLATTMIVLGATASALGQLLTQYMQQFTLIGGLLVVGFGVMSLLGKGFSGLQILDRPAASVTGSYLYGATFALGWTACVGPILGALLTLLAAQGGAVLQGAALALLYALGLGTPLILSASLFSRLGPESRLWRIMRGRGVVLTLGPVTLQSHTTSIASGVLLIGVGLLLMTGQLAVFSTWAVQTSLSQQLLDLEDGMRVLLLGR